MQSRSSLNRVPQASQNGPLTGRFAPSPTGKMHAGNIFSALVAWLVAKSTGGDVVLRIEDLDPDRSKPHFADEIQRDFEMLGLTWDRGPYFQSTRSDAYREAFNALASTHEVYPCFCTRADMLAAASAPQAAAQPAEAPRSSAPQVAGVAENSSYVYPGTCKNLSPQHVETLIAEGKDISWRIAVPDEYLSYTDEIYGKYCVNLARECGDFILLRKDNTFAYHLAVVVDDAEQGITSVVRGSDLLSSTPQQIFLQDSLGFDTPNYFHVPLICAQDGRRLAKRNKDAALDELLSQYKSPEGVIGHIAYLSGLQASDSPATPESLLPSFSLETCRKLWSNSLTIPWTA